MNNDALKHNGSETKNETWTKLLQELKFFEGEDDHIMYLRRRFVLGASESMSGSNGSNQNDKALFGYTDEEWSFIWMTMIEDGAWAVPSIKDKDGNTIKANWAPEILIKFIAHELKCHIIVFDLLLNTVQFLSGNHVKSDNVVFDSPLLIYTTGGHFQSVFPMDHEYFINYAKELEAEHNPRDREIRKFNVYLKTGNEKADLKDKQSSSTSKVYSKDTTPGKPKKNMKMKPEKGITEESKPESALFDLKSEPPAKKRKSMIDAESLIDRIKHIKTKDRTPEERKILEKLRKIIQREETEDKARQKKDKEEAQINRDDESKFDQIKSIKAKDRNSEERKLLERLRKSIQREKETEDKTRQKKDQEETQIHRDDESEIDQIKSTKAKDRTQEERKILERLRKSTQRRNET